MQAMGALMSQIKVCNLKTFPVKIDNGLILVEL
jgi:hypothetical protein